jgi:hypothetical protein
LGQEQINQSKIILFIAIIIAIIYVIIVFIYCYFGWYSICCEKDEINENDTNSTIDQLFIDIDNNHIDKPENVHFNNAKKYDDDNKTLCNGK